MEVLSEHMCEGWLEGYLLTGRHGLFSCYEAFIHIIDSMMNQHAKWLKVTRTIPWRKPIASLNYLLTSHVWRQDHNGFSHQDPGFIDHVANKKSELVRIYLPPDANCLLSVADHCLRSRGLHQPGRRRQAAGMAVARHRRRPPGTAPPALGIWEWASDGEDPDVVMACAGDVPTLETLAAVTLLRAIRAGHPHPGGQRGGPDGAATADRASARPGGPATSTACSRRTSPSSSPSTAIAAMIHKLTYRRNNATTHPRPRLQGRRHHHDAVRHGGAEQPRPLPAGVRC